MASLTVIGLGIAAAGVGLSAYGQVEAANAQDKTAAASAKGAQRQAEAIRRDYVNNLRILRQRELQINAEATDEMSKRRDLADRAIAQLTVSAGEAGIGGNSVRRAKSAVFSVLGRDLSTLAANRFYQVRQLGYERESLKIKAESGQMSAQASVQPGANWGAIGLQIGSEAVQFAGKAGVAAYQLSKTP